MAFRDILSIFSQGVAWTSNRSISCIWFNRDMQIVLDDVETFGGRFGADKRHVRNEAR